MIKVETSTPAARKQAALAHIKHIDTQIMKLQPLVAAYTEERNSTTADDALEDIRRAVRVLRNTLGK